MSVIFASEAFQAAPALFSIREETASDVVARETLLDCAMGPGRTLKSSEAIRRGRIAAEGLSFGAIDTEGTLVGTVRLWNVRAGSRGGVAVPGLLLGPLAVAPSLTGAGIGSALMLHAIAAASERGHGVILLVGDVEYYGRFGLSAAATGGLALPSPFDPARLLAIELTPGAIENATGVIAPTGRLHQAQDCPTDPAAPTPSSPAVCGRTPIRVVSEGLASPDSGLLAIGTDGIRDTRSRDMIDVRNADSSAPGNVSRRAGETG